jgi:hypothetical protein
MSNSIDLNSLLDDAGLDAQASAAMALTADNLGPAIMAGLGDVSLDDVNSSELVLVTLLIDDSSSISYVAGNSDAVRTGHNTVIDSLSGTKQSGDVLISCRYLNDNPPTDQGVLYPYRPLSGAIRLDSSNYNPRGGTPLYDQVAVTLTGVAAKLAEFEAGGVAARGVTAFITDGADYGSYTHRSPKSVHPIIEGLLKTEQHIIAAMGIDDGSTPFRDIFQQMGVLQEWILTPGNTPSEIRKAWNLVSQSAVRASQSAGSFSQTAMGGFGA